MRSYKVEFMVEAPSIKEIKKALKLGLNDPRNSASVNVIKGTGGFHVLRQRTNVLRQRTNDHNVNFHYDRRAPWELAEALVSSVVHINEHMISVLQSYIDTYDGQTEIVDPVLNNHAESTEGLEYHDTSRLEWAVDNLKECNKDIENFILDGLYFEMPHAHIFPTGEEDKITYDYDCIGGWKDSSA